MNLWLIAIQVLGVVLAISAMWFMGNETLWGPTLSFLSGLPFIALYIGLGAYLAPLMTITLMAIDVRNFLKWRREGLGWRKREAQALDLSDILTNIEPTETPFLASLHTREPWTPVQ